MSNFVSDNYRHREGTTVWLHARDGRAVLSDDADDHAAPDARREADPHNLAIGADLANALHEWARVANAVARAGIGRPNETDEPAGPPVNNAASDLVSRRGRQLAGRVAAAMGAPVNYADPLTGEVVEVGVPTSAHPDGERLPQHAADIEPAEPAGPPEPTPWTTGVTVSIVTGILMMIIVVALSLAVGETTKWLALIANVVIALGLAPSVWLARNALVWRWVAWGVVGGIGVAWLALLFTLA